FGLPQSVEFGDDLAGGGMIFARRVRGFVLLAAGAIAARRTRLGTGRVWVFGRRRARGRRRVPSRRGSAVYGPRRAVRGRIVGILAGDQREQAKRDQSSRRSVQHACTTPRPRRRVPRK